MKIILRADQNPSLDVALLHLYIRIHTSIQQHRNLNDSNYGMNLKDNAVNKVSQGNSL